MTGQWLSRIGRYGRWVLPLGLVAGIASPDLSVALKPTLPISIALLLLVSCLRIDTRATASAPYRGTIVWLVVLVQMIVPLLMALLLQRAGVQPEWAIPLVLVMAAAPITGSASIVILLGGDARLALNLLLTGTALLPITAVPVLWILDLTLSMSQFIESVVRLALLIVGAWMAARWLQGRFPSLTHAESSARLDGAAALLLAWMVIALMAGVHDAWDQPGLIARTLLWAMAINVGLQCLGAVVAARWSSQWTTAAGVAAGNRNIALFLGALPATTTEPLLLFIACYQVPMFLTPLVGSYVYRSAER